MKQLVSGHKLYGQERKMTKGSLYINRFFLSFVEKLTNECLSCEFSHKITLKHILLTSVALLQADVSIVHKYFKKLLQDKRYNLFQKSFNYYMFFSNENVPAFCHCQCVLYLFIYFVYRGNDFQIQYYENQ